jgi:hypothetical protein
MDPNMKLVLDKLDDFGQRFDGHEAWWERRFTDLDQNLSSPPATTSSTVASPISSLPAPMSIDPDIVQRITSKVLGFVLEKNSVPTELDEYRENSDEFQTQFGEISECKA